jgi:hypothetical protein
MIYLAFILVRFNVPVHVYFDKEERPFLLDADMRWAVEPNAFLVYVSVIKGKTGSPRTWRSYAYQFADWLAFCEKIGVEWRHATLLTIATYVLCRLEMEPLPQIAGNIVQNSVNFVLIQLRPHHVRRYPIPA